MMKRLVAWVPVLLTMAIVSGCIDSQSYVLVKKDGSGFVIETIYFSPQTAQMMQGMAGMASGMAQGMGGGPASPPPSNPLSPNKEQFNERAGELGQGVKFVSSAKVDKTGGWTGYRATYSFDDITRVTLSMNDAAGSQDGPGNAPGAAPGMSEQSAPKPKPEPVTFGFQKGETPTLTINLPQQKAPAQGDASAMPPQITPEMRQQMAMQTAMMKPMMQGMHMSMIIKVDGDIQSSTATHVMKSSTTQKKQLIVLYDMDFDKILANDALFEDLMAQGDSHDLSAASGKLKGVEGIKVEDKEQVKVTFISL